MEFAEKIPVKVPQIVMVDRAKYMIYHKDPAGNTIKFFNYSRTPLPTMVGDQVACTAHWKDFKARPDDIYICRYRYSKCGTNWTWEIIKMLLSSTTEYMKENKMSTMMEIQDLDALDAMSSPRVLNTHLVVHQLPPDVLAKGCKILYLLRNPKDVTVSGFYHHRNLVKVYDYHGDWSNYFHLCLEGKGESRLNFTDEAKKLAELMGVQQNDDFFQRLAQRCDIKNMKAAKQSTFSSDEHALWRDGEARFLRKGITGDGKRHFTVEQNERFDAVLKQRLKGSHLKFIHEP
ncbi:sulfotransferase 1C4-like [Liolophura sinensis]|uniref:sulfotransferase 1C4-like n=1 Tax=Liolophura sinensis TaxID=3198878 RepID=UPI003158422F